MRIIAATLCDFAQVRDGLLSILSGGVSRIWRDEFPAPMGVMLALMFEVSADELKDVIEARCSVEDQDGEKVFDAVIALQGGMATGLDAGELIQAPFIFDLRNVGLPQEGRYMVRSWLPKGADAERGEMCLSFAARPKPAPPQAAEG